jgi:hypothetical protein
MIRGEDLALLIENQRRKTDTSERLADDTRPVKLKARPQQTGEMGPQFHRVF